MSQLLLYGFGLILLWGSETKLKWNKRVDHEHYKKSYEKRVEVKIKDSGTDGKGRGRAAKNMTNAYHGL